MNEFTRQYQERQRQLALSQRSEPDPLAQLPIQTGEVYDAATREWVNVWNGSRRLDGTTWKPETSITATVKGQSSPIWIGPRLLTYLPPHQRFILMAAPDPESARSEAHGQNVVEDDRPAIPELPDDFDLKAADDYEVCCFIWLRLLPSQRFTLASWQQYCREVFGIGLQKAKRIHHYLADCGSLEVSKENRPGVRPITWYCRSIKPPTRFSDEEDDIDQDGVE